MIDEGGCDEGGCEGRCIDETFRIQFRIHFRSMTTMMTANETQCILVSLFSLFLLFLLFLLLEAPNPVSNLRGALRSQDPVSNLCFRGPVARCGLKILFSARCGFKNGWERVLENP